MAGERGSPAQGGALCYRAQRALGEFGQVEVSELYDGELVVELEADGAGFGTLRVAGVFGDGAAV